MEYMISIVQYVLTTFGLKENRNRIYEILFSDPAFPSAMSLVKTLSYYGMAVNAYKIGIQQLIAEKRACIVHCNINEGRFFVVKKISSDSIVLFDGNEHHISLDVFSKSWDGIVLLAEAAKSPRHLEGERNKKWLWSLLLAVAAIMLFLSNITFPRCILFLIDCVGLLLSYLLIVKTSLKYIQMPFCHYGKKLDCDSVSRSKPFGRIINIDMPFVGCAFFLFNLLSVDCYGAYYAVIGILASLVVLYLFVYQVVYLKKYCLYCIAVGTLVIANTYVRIVTNDCCFVCSQQLVFNMSFAIVVSLLASKFLFCYYQTKRSLIDNRLSLLKVKRATGVFRCRIGSSKSLELSEENALVFGSENGKYVIDTVVSLQCKHCRKVIYEMARLLDTYPEKIKWRLYMAENIDNGDNSQALQVIEQYEKDKSRAISMLRKGKNAKCFEVSPKTIEKFKAAKNELRMKNINHFPAIVFNGVLFPEEYQVHDLHLLINDWAQGENFT